MNYIENYVKPVAKCALEAGCTVVGNAVAGYLGTRWFTSINPMQGALFCGLARAVGLVTQPIFSAIGQKCCKADSTARNFAALGEVVGGTVVTNAIAGKVAGLTIGQCFKTFGASLLVALPITVVVAIFQIATGRVKLLITTKREEEAPASPPQTPLHKTTAA